MSLLAISGVAVTVAAMAVGGGSGGGGACRYSTNLVSSIRHSQVRIW